MGINIITTTSTPIPATRDVKPDKFNAVGNPIYLGLETDRMITTGAVIGVSTIKINLKPANGSSVTIAGYTFYFLTVPDAFNPFNVLIGANPVAAATNLAAAIMANANTLPYFTGASVGPIVTITAVNSEVTLAIATSTSPNANSTAAVVTANVEVVYRDNYRLNVDLFIDRYFNRGNTAANMKRLRRISIPTGKVAKETTAWDYYQILFELQEAMKPELEFDLPNITLLVAQSANRCIRRFRMEYTETYGTLTSSNKVFTVAGGPFYVLNATCPLYPSLMGHQMSGLCPAPTYKWDWPNTLKNYFEFPSFRWFLTENLTRQTYPGALEYLCWWIPNASVDIYAVQVTRYFYDGTSDKILLDTDMFTGWHSCDTAAIAPALPSESIFVIPIHKVWYQSPNFMAGVEYFEIRIKNPIIDTVYSNTVTYYIDWDCKEFHTVVFKNKFGVPDTFHLTGALACILQIDRLESKVAMDKRPVYQGSRKNNFNYAFEDVYEWRGVQPLDLVTQPLFQELQQSSETWLLKPYVTTGRCCLFTCKGEYVFGEKDTPVSTKFLKYYPLFGKCGDFVVIVNPYNISAKTFSIVDGIFVNATTTTAVPDSIFFTVTPTNISNFMGVQVTFGVVISDDWRYRVFCPDEYEDCGKVFLGTLPSSPDSNWVAYRIYVGRAVVNPVVTNYNLPVGASLDVFYGAGPVAGVNGPGVGVLNFNKNNTNHDWIVVMVRNTTASPVNYQFSVNCTPGSFLPRDNACVPEELTPVLFSDTEYNFANREPGPNEVEFKFLESRDNQINTR